MSVKLMTSQCSTHQTLVRIVLHLVAAARTRLTAMASMVVPIMGPFVGRRTVSYSMSERVALYTDVFVGGVTVPTAQSAVEHFPRAVTALVTKFIADIALVLLGRVVHAVAQGALDALVRLAVDANKRVPWAVTALVTRAIAISELVLLGRVVHAAAQGALGALVPTKVGVANKHAQKCDKHVEERDGIHGVGPVDQ
jgi:hypothetical protein